MQDSIDIKSLIIGLVTAIGKSQYEMDRNSIKKASQLLDSGLTEQMGLTAHWYAIPEAELLIKMLLEITTDRELRSQLVDAAYASKYNIDTTLSSDFKLKIKRIPLKTELNVTIQNEKLLLGRVSRIRQVAQMLHDNEHSFLNITFHPFEGSALYNGGNWYIELVHPPKEGSKQVSGLIMKAILIVDDESGEIITAKYLED
ncbi:MAG: hypothetical protein GDA37_02090 [Ekhidna sp.]|nr:hypothetical protein [Ekhidna sp.]